MKTSLIPVFVTFTTLALATAAMILVSVTVAEGKLEAGRSLQCDITTEILLEEETLRVKAKLLIERSDIVNDDLVLFLNAGLRVTSILDENGRQVDFTRDEQQIKISSLMSNNEEQTQLLLEYEGVPESFMGTADVGPEGAYASWLTFWYPSVPLVSGLFGRNRFIVPKGLVVASNGTLTEHNVYEDTDEFVFDVTTPLYYSFSAGKYYFTSRKIDGPEFKTYFLSGEEEKAKFYIEKAAPVISFYKELFGIYPYENFALVELPAPNSYRGGGFSEQGMVLLPGRSVPDNYFNFPIMVHEMGHLWWGNWVIGDEFVMSEGLAQLSYLLWAEHVYSEDIMRKYMNYGSLDHFISVYLYEAQFSRPEKEETLLDTSDFSRDHHVVMTAKGPKVFLMLRDIIGKDAFTRGLRKAVAEYAHTRMPLEQFFKEWEKLSGMDLGWFYSQWVKRTGVPVLELDWTDSMENSQHVVHGKITQKSALPYRLPLEIGIKTGDGVTLHMIEVQDESTTFRITSDSRPRSVVLDPSNKALFRNGKDQSRTLFGEAVDIVTSRSNYETARAKLEAMLAEFPDDMVARAWLGFYSHRFLEDDDEAIRHLIYLVDNADPLGEYELYYSRSCFLLGKLHDMKGEREKAIEYYRKTLELDRTERFHNLATEYLQKPFTM